MSFDQRPARIRKKCWVQSSSQTEREHRLFVTKRTTLTEKNAKNLINSSGIPASLRYALKKIFYQTAYTVWIQIHHIQHTFQRVLTQVPDNIYFCFPCGKKKKKNFKRLSVVIQLVSAKPDSACFSCCMVFELVDHTSF